MTVTNAPQEKPAELPKLNGHPSPKDNSSPFSFKTMYPPKLVVECAGAAAFDNRVLFALIFAVPYLFSRLFSFGWTTQIILTGILAPAIGALSLWGFSYIAPHPTDQTDPLPNKPLETYIKIHDEELSAKYNKHKKIPMELFFERYFDGDIDIVGDCLDVFEKRYDWATFEITWSQAKFFIFQWIPELLWHSKKQDETQVRDHYDRGDDFYEAFLGPMMVYTSGMVGNPNERESLEVLQTNKLDEVCKRVQLQPGDRHLDIGCGWGTLVCHAAKNYGTQSLGITLGRNQTAHGNNKASEMGVGDRAELLCMDYRDIPRRPRYNKITCLEMAEHVGVRHFETFLHQVRDMLEDDGLFFLQIAGLRGAWQYEDFVWGLFMAKYIFPGADASCPLNWVVGKLEKCGFEVRTSHTIGIHYSITIGRWYENWMRNREKIISSYGKRWFRIWEVFLAWSVIIARQGSSTCYQILAHKNRNGFDRSKLMLKPLGFEEETSS
ncbi:hypothetical protein H4219_004267 [Mycoemilia scoparia]|uniref:sphingolipid C(9)-methyltransferase n=1 Tax=Mycoemilia scoparia TaxID=417184 RepID=A0A9W8DRM9_9FUNG|nr:hypothetical protein H4219_004267 [Mycoemilia scoparia]